MQLPNDVETVSTSFPTTFTWDYAHHDPQLARLYTNAKRDQWDGATTLDWSRNVEPEAENLPDTQIAIYGSTLGSLEELRRLVAMWGRGAFVPVVDRVFPFREAVAALDLLEGGEHFGKVGLDMAAT